MPRQMAGCESACPIYYPEAMMTKRDYSLVGESTRIAIETGLASAEWYHTDVPRKAMKELMQRSDGPAIRDTLIWIVAILADAADLKWDALE